MPAGTRQTGAWHRSDWCNTDSSPDSTDYKALISNLLPLCHQASKKSLEEKQLPITVPEIRLPGESSLLFENCQESSAKESLDK
jgi:hypothetical protein